MRKVLRTGFVSGLVSEDLACRYEVEVCQRGCSVVDNMVIAQLGGVRRRRGLRRVCEGVSDEGRLVPFVFSADDVCVLEFFPGGLRVLRGDVEVFRVGSGCVWDDAAKVRSMRVKQVNDVVWVVGRFAPQLVKRFANDDWRVEGVRFDCSPDASSVLQDKVMALSGINGGEWFLSADGVFGGAVVGDVVRVNQRMVSKSVFGAANSAMTGAVYGPSGAVLDVMIMLGGVVKFLLNGVVRCFTCIKGWSPGLKVRGNDPGVYADYFRAGYICSEAVACVGAWSVVTDGVWSGRVDVVRSESGMGSADWWMSFDQKRLLSMEGWGNARRNYNKGGVEDSFCFLMLVAYSYAEGEVPVPSVMVDEFLWRRELKVSEVVSDSKVRVTFDYQGYSGLSNPFSTRDWSLGAFGFKSGFPCSVAFFQDRVWFAGTEGQPQTVWASAVGDYYDFDIDRAGGDAALRFTLAGAGQSRICWVDALRGLAVGTSDAEWSLSSSEGVIDAKSAYFSRQSSVGSADLECETVENGLVYVQRGGKRVRQFAYSLEADGYVAEDLTVFAGGVLDSGVVELAYQRSPEAVLWCVLGDGSCATMTYNSVQRVKAWGRVRTEGDFLSVAVVPAADGGGDDVWCLVRREGMVWVEVMRDEGNVFLDGFDVGDDGVARGVSFVSEVRTNDLVSGFGDVGELRGSCSVDLLFRGSAVAGVEVDVGGGYGGLSESRGVLDGWERVCVPGGWGREAVVGVRASGLGDCCLLGCVLRVI